jgi:toxin ParE1/3/4
MFCLFTANAEEDLENIADYIALDNPLRALSFIQEIRERCHRIADAPQGYPLAPEYGDDIRKLPFGNYLIFYTLCVDSVVILHITHSARGALSTL